MPSKTTIIFLVQGPLKSHIARGPRPWPSWTPPKTTTASTRSVPTCYNQHHNGNHLGHSEHNLNPLHPFNTPTIKQHVDENNPTTDGFAVDGPPFSHNGHHYVISHHQTGQRHRGGVGEKLKVEVEESRKPERGYGVSTGSGVVSVLK